MRGFFPKYLVLMVYQDCECTSTYFFEVINVLIILGTEKPVIPHAVDIEISAKNRRSLLLTIQLSNASKLIFVNQKNVIFIKFDIKKLIFRTFQKLL